MFALYVYNQSERLSEITYHTLQEKVFDPSGIEGVSAAYSGESYDSGVLQKISITVWNSGRKSLDIGDVRQKLSLRGDGFEIIWAKIRIQNPEFSGFRIDDQNDLYTIEWDFFDAGYFFVVDLFMHSDSMDTKPILALEATKFSGLINYCQSFSKFNRAIIFILAIPIGVTIFVTFLSIFDKLGEYKGWLENRSIMVKTTYQITTYLTAVGILSLGMILIFTVSPILFFNYYETFPTWLEFLIDIPAQISDVSCPKQ